MNIKRGDIFYADLSPVVGSEQGGIRPVLIVQNNVGNRFSPTVIAAAITSQKSKANLPTHIQLRANDSGLSRDSVVLLEQIRTLDKRRLKEKMGTCRTQNCGGSCVVWEQYSAGPLCRSWKDVPDDRSRYGSEASGTVTKKPLCRAEPSDGTVGK